MAQQQKKAQATRSCITSTRAAGKYTATLTVFRGGEESSASVTITVTAKPKPAGGGHPAEGVYVTVKGEGDEPIDGATVLYVGSGGARIEAASGSSGEAVLKGLPEGTDTVYVYKSGLRPGDEHGGGQRRRRRHGERDARRRAKSPRRK